MRSPTLNPNLFQVGRDWHPGLGEAFAAASVEPHWTRNTAYDAYRGSSWAATKRNNKITGTGSTFTNLRLKDLWADLGDGVYHKVVAIHSNTVIETDDYIDSVPGTIALTFWTPTRKSVMCEFGDYAEAIRLDESACLTFAAEPGTRWANSFADYTDGTALTTFNVSTAFSLPAVDAQSGDIEIDGFNITTVSQGEASVFDGAVFSKGYDNTAPQDPVGRMSFRLRDCVLTSLFHADVISLWHPGDVVLSNCDLIGTEQAMEYIAADRAYAIHCRFSCAKKITGVHYTNGALLDFTWTGITTHLKGGNALIGCALNAENNQNTAAFEGLNDMGNIALLAATSEDDGNRTNPTATIYSIGNLHTVNIPGPTYSGQAIRVANYNAAGSAGITLKSFFDSMHPSGDLTKYTDAFGDRGNIEMYYPYKTPSTAFANGGSASVVKV